MKYYNNGVLRNFTSVPLFGARKKHLFTLFNIDIYFYAERILDNTINSNGILIKYTTCPSILVVSRIFGSNLTWIKYNNRLCT